MVSTLQSSGNLPPTPSDFISCLWLTFCNWVKTERELHTVFSAFRNWKITCPPVSCRLPPALHLQTNWTNLTAVQGSLKVQSNIYQKNSVCGCCCDKRNNHEFSAHEPRNNTGLEFVVCCSKMPTISMWRACLHTVQRMTSWFPRALV